MPSLAAIKRKNITDPHDQVIITALIAENNLIELFKWIRKTFPNNELFDYGQSTLALMESVLISPNLMGILFAILD